MTRQALPAVLIAFGPTIIATSPWLERSTAFHGAPQPSSATDSRRVDIVYNSSIPSDVYTRLALAGGSVIDMVPSLNFVIAQNQSSTSQSDFIQHVKSDNNVKWVFADPLGAFAMSPNDKYYAGYQWNIQHTHADWAWNITTGSRDVKIVIIDSGVDCLVHEDLQGLCDAVNSTAEADAYGHGTFVAGVASALINNQAGIAGMSQSSVVALGPLCADAYTCGQIPIVLYGEVIVYMVKAAEIAGRRVINISYGFTLACHDHPDSEECQLLQLAINGAYGSGAIVVAAAGNDSRLGPCALMRSPADMPHVIGVGASNLTDGRWSERDCGPTLAILAPGQAIPSTVPTTLVGMCSGDGGSPIGDTTNYCVSSGTSFSAPQVVGTAALIWPICPNLSNNQVTNLILSTAQDEGLPTNEQGHGLLRPDLAVNATNYPNC